MRLRPHELVQREVFAFVCLIYKRRKRVAHTKRAREREWGVEGSEGASEVCHLFKTSI